MAYLKRISADKAEGTFNAFELSGKDHLGGQLANFFVVGGDGGDPIAEDVLHLVFVVGHHTAIGPEGPVVLFDLADEGIQVVIRDNDIGFAMLDFSIFDTVDNGMFKSVDLAENAEPAYDVRGVKFGLGKHQVQTAVFTKQIQATSQGRLNVLVVFLVDNRVVFQFFQETVHNKDLLTGYFFDDFADTLIFVSEVGQDDKVVVVIKVVADDVLKFIEVVVVDKNVNAGLDAHGFDEGIIDASFVVAQFVEDEAYS